VVLLNALISLAVALTVAWVIDARRPDPEELAALGVIQGAQSSGVAGGVDLPPVATVAPAGANLTPSAGSAEAAQPAAPAPAVEAGAGETFGGETYVVLAGESLSGIASKLGVTVDELVSVNELPNPDYVFSGQILKVPGTGAAPEPTPEEGTLGTTGLQVRTISGAGVLGSEFVELVNDTDLNFNLQGWKVQRAGGPEYVFSELLVFPGGSVRLHSGSGTDSTIDRYWAQSAPVWASGATAVLQNAQGEGVAEYVVP
jgi:LysM repeat protein